MPIRKENTPRKRLVSSNGSIIIYEGDVTNIITSASSGILQYMASDEAEWVAAWNDARAAELTAEILIDGPIGFTQDRDFIIERGEPAISFKGYPRNIVDFGTHRINFSRVQLDDLTFRTASEKYFWVKEGYLTLNNPIFADDVLYNANIALMKTHIACYSNANNNTGRIIIDGIEHYSQTVLTNQSGDIQPIVITNSGANYTQLYVVLRNVNSVLSYERFSRALLKADVNTPFKVTGDNSWRFHQAQDMPDVNNIGATSELFFRIPVLNLKRYDVFLTQTGTNAPTANVRENTLLPAVSYTGVGQYDFTKAGAFTVDKTNVFEFVLYDNAGNKIFVERISDDVIRLHTYAAADTATHANGILTNFRFVLESKLI